MNYLNRDLWWKSVYLYQTSWNRLWIVWIDRNLDKRSPPFLAMLIKIFTRIIHSLKHQLLPIKIVILLYCDPFRFIVFADRSKGLIRLIVSSHSSKNRNARYRGQWSRQLSQTQDISYRSSVNNKILTLRVSRIRCNFISLFLVLISSMQFQSLHMLQALDKNLNLKIDEEEFLLLSR